MSIEMYEPMKNDITEENIDNLVNIITRKWNLYKKDNKYGTYYFTTPDIKLGKIIFSFCIVINYSNNEIKETYLEYTIDDNCYSYMNREQTSKLIDIHYFRSKTIKELVSKFINSKFVYHKAQNRITTLETFEDHKTIDKFFHSDIECSVCNDLISPSLITSCNHPLCLECYLSLKKKTCPICRKCLNPDCEHSDSEDE